MNRVTFFVCVLVILAKTGIAQISSDIDVWYPVYPILQKKSHTPVAQINIQSPAKGLRLNEVIVRIEHLKENSIDSVQVFYSGQDSVFSTQQRLATATAQNQTHLKNRITLKKGSNYLWVSLWPSEKLSPTDRLKVYVETVVIDGKKHSLPTKDVPLLRAGIALRQHGEDNVDTYRIPGLVTTPQGTLIAVYDVRYNSSVDLQEDIDIGMSRSTDGGETWEPMRIIMDQGEWGGLSEKANGVGDPAILIDPTTNTIWVAGLWTHGYPGQRAWDTSGPGLTPEETGQFLLVKSEDNGLTWSEPINITQQIKDPSWTLLLQGPGRGTTTSDGTLVFPAQYKDAEGMPYATVIYSTDQGQNWQIGQGAKSNTTEAQVVALKDNSWMLNMRDNRGGSRSVYVTSDRGHSWTSHPTSRQALIEPICMASLIVHQRDGKRYLVFSNPNATDQRHRMTIQVSEDEGMSWPESYHLLLDEWVSRGYSSLTSINEDTLGILYESSQADLVFQKIGWNELLKSQ